MNWKTLTLVAAVACATAGLVMAEDAAKRRDNKDRIEVAGTFASVGATLESRGANAEDTLNTKGALGLVDADGLLWSFVDNAKGHGVITNDKLKGKETKVLGWKFPKTQFIEISKYQLKEGDRWAHFDYCKTCGWEEGNNNDKDLCEDCAKENKK
jgi:hypothetical protein